VRISVVGFIGCLGGLLFATFQQALAQSVIHTEKSLYRNIAVTDDDEGVRCMRFSRNYGGSRQSCMSIRDPDRLVFDYTKMMLGSLYLDPAPRRILVVGLGGGTLPTALMHLFPASAIDVVEVDGAVIRVARDYFAFKPRAGVRVFEEDGRVFIKRAGMERVRYDLVLLDAFEHDYIPEHMLTREFLGEVKTVLALDGVLAANTFSSSRLYDHESTTYEAAFGTFYNLKLSNRVIIATSGRLPSLQAVERNARVLDAQLKPLGVDTEWLLKMFSTSRDWATDARVLTDQYSPANLLNGR
jgi:spermidine synthase